MPEQERELLKLLLPEREREQLMEPTEEARERLSPREGGLHVSVESPDFGRNCGSEGEDGHLLAGAEEILRTGRTGEGAITSAMLREMSRLISFGLKSSTESTISASMAVLPFTSLTELRRSPGRSAKQACRSPCPRFERRCSPSFQ